MACARTVIPPRQWLLGREPGRTRRPCLCKERRGRDAPVRFTAWRAPEAALVRVPAVLRGACRQSPRRLPRGGLHAHVRQGSAGHKVGCPPTSWRKRLKPDRRHGYCPERAQRTVCWEQALRRCFRRRRSQVWPCPRGNAQKRPENSVLHHGSV